MILFFPLLGRLDLVFEIMVGEKVLVVHEVESVQEITRPGKLLPCDKSIVCAQMRPFGDSRCNLIQDQNIRSYYIPRNCNYI